jgi:hypothetical protein
MSARWDICQAKPGKGGKTYWNKVATMWEAKDGRFSIEFDALPVPVAEQSDNGEISIRTRAVAFPAKATEQSQSSGGSGWGGGDFDDEIQY